MSEPPTAPGDELPLPVVAESTAVATDRPEPRTYIEIRPAERPVNPEAVTQAMELLHSRLRERTDNGFFDRLRGNTSYPLVEWLLVADGRSDPRIRWLAGARAIPTATLEETLRMGLPGTYEVRTVEWHPQHIESRLSSEDPFVTGVKYYARTERRRDWQTPLTPVRERRDSPQGQPKHSHRRPVPLAAILTAMRETSQPVIYQVVAQPLPDWSDAADQYLFDLQNRTVTLGTMFLDLLLGQPSNREYEPTAQDRTRVKGVESRNARQSFLVSARAVVLADADQTTGRTTAKRMADALSQVHGPNHELAGRVVSDGDDGLRNTTPGTDCYEKLLDRYLHKRTYTSRTAWLPGKQPTSRGIVADATEFSALWLLDGDRLPPDGKRALATRPGDRTAIALPPPGQLARYQPPGMALCMPLTQDREPRGDPVYLDPGQQDRHCIIVGGTGAGKSVLIERGLLTNTAATSGLDILFDYKGGSTATEYLRAHYAEYGTLDDVLYFDCSRVLPALSFFDIEPLLDAGVPREEARSRKAGHYESILAGLIGTEQYGEATESVKAIRNHLRALYDPVHGDDEFSHQAFYEALQTTQSGETMPSVSDEALGSYFDGLQDRDRDTFGKILAGAVGRVETIATDGRLAPLFNHQTSDSAGRFDFADVLDEDRVVIFDFGGMEDRIKRALTLVLLSSLWTALKAREQATDEDADLPLVNLYLEEAGDLAATDLVDTLLAQGRSFGLSLLLGLQYPEQLSTEDPSDDTYQEALNETATFVVGNVGVDSELASVLATESLPERALDRRLSAMGRGEWLVRPASAFGEATVQPFLAESLSAPPGHPASDSPLTGRVAEEFDAALEAVRSRTATEAGLAHEQPSTTDDADDSDQPGAADPQSGLATRSLLPHTRRLPDCVTYDPAIQGLRCANCDNRYDATSTGLHRAIDCCHSIDEVDPAEIPVCDCQLKLSPEEIEDRDWSLSQLLLLQAVYNAQQGRYDPPAYDIISDSMVRLEEYVDIDKDARQELLDAGLLRRDTDYPHRLYSVPPAGRDCIGESHRRGVDYGHGKGDLNESAEHAFGVELGRRWLQQTYQQDPDSPVETIQPYYELDDGSIPASAFMGTGESVQDDGNRRLDIAGLDSDGEIVVTVEVERVNHDIKTAVPEDFDKMAACNPDAAIWIVMSRADGHEILSVLNDPPDGAPRVEKTYNENTSPHQFVIDTPGLTAMYPASTLQDEVVDRG